MKTHETVKTTFKLLMSLVILTTAVTVFQSCKSGADDPGPGGGDATEAEKVSALMKKGTWKLNSVTVDGVAKNLYAGMTITFTQDGFTTTKADPVWPANGTWAFADNTAKAIVRNDQTTVTIESINDANMTLSLTWTKTTLGPGRVESIAGKHVFVFGK